MTTIRNMLSPMGSLIISEQSRHPNFGPVCDPQNGAIRGFFVNLTVQNGVPGVQECGSTPFVFCQKSRFFEDFPVFDSQICKTPTDGSILKDTKQVQMWDEISYISLFLTVRFAKPLLIAPFSGSETCPKRGPVVSK